MVEKLFFLYLVSMSAFQNILGIAEDQIRNTEGRSLVR